MVKVSVSMLSYEKSDKEDALKFGRKHSTQQAGERVELVQPRLPEVGQVGVRDRDTTELGQDNHDRRVEQDGDLNGGRD